jgi:hypothetical protein
VTKLSLFLQLLLPLLLLLELQLLSQPLLLQLLPLLPPVLLQQHRRLQHPATHCLVAARSKQHRKAFADTPICCTVVY